MKRWESGNILSPRQTICNGTKKAKKNNTHLIYYLSICIFLIEIDSVYKLESENEKKKIYDES